MSLVNCKSANAQHGKRIVPRQAFDDVFRQHSGFDGACAESVVADNDVGIEFGKNISYSQVPLPILARLFLYIGIERDYSARESRSVVFSCIERFNNILRLHYSREPGRSLSFLPWYRKKGTQIWYTIRQVIG